MQGLSSLIQRCIEQKKGNKEFALFYLLDVEHTWLAMLGNELPVPLGESSGEFMGAGLSPEEAVENLHSNLTKGILNQNYSWMLALHLTPWLKDFAEGREYDMWNDDDEDRLYNDLMDYMRSKTGICDDGQD
jgi:hypothetical protein